MADFTFEAKIDAEDFEFTVSTREKRYKKMSRTIKKVKYSYEDGVFWATVFFNENPENFYMVPVLEALRQYYRDESEGDVQQVLRYEIDVSDKRS